MSKTGDIVTNIMSNCYADMSVVFDLFLFQCGSCAPHTVLCWQGNNNAFDEEREGLSCCFACRTVWNPAF